jgi:hypothetical protein
LSRLKRHRATERAIDKQIGGNHYKGKIQPIELIISHNLNFIDGNIVKYAVRKKKGESLKTRYEKIKHYCDLGIELIKE